MDQKPIDYVYFKCEDHDVYLICPHQAQILEPLDPSDTAAGFSFDLANFFCPEAGENTDDPDCLESWTAVVDEE